MVLMLLLGFLLILVILLSLLPVLPPLELSKRGIATQPRPITFPHTYSSPPEQLSNGRKAVIWSAFSLASIATGVLGLVPFWLQDTSRNHELKNLSFIE